MLERATQFMVREYGVPAQMVDEDCRDRWHERLGLLAEFITDLGLPEDTEPREFWCGVCNTKMVEVRPGVWQHDDVGCLSERRGAESGAGICRRLISGSG